VSCSSIPHTAELLLPFGALFSHCKHLQLPPKEHLLSLLNQPLLLCLSLLLKHCVIVGPDAIWLLLMSWHPGMVLHSMAASRPAKTAQSGRS
jgi:hypothetical protein